jgi:hypothetical protein
VQGPLPFVNKLFNITPERWQIFSRALAPATLKMYALALKQAVDRRKGSIPALTCEDVIEVFTPLAGKSRAQITCLRQALCTFQAMGGYDEPPFDKAGIKLFFKGLFRMAPSPTDRRLPMTLDIARAVFNYWAGWKSKAAQRNAAFFVLQLVSLHRFSEVAACERSHFVDLGEGKGLLWFVPKSKTDQECVGHHVPIPEFMAAGFACAKVIRNYARIAPKDSGRFFRPTITQGTAWAPSTKPDGSVTSIDLNTWNATLRQAIAKTCPREDPSRYSSHSMRSGGATSLIEQGVSLHECQLLLGHASQTAIKAYHKKRQDHARQLLSRLYAS